MSGDEGVLVEPEADPVAPPDGGVLELDDGEDDGALEAGAFFESSPQAAKVNAAAAAIRRALVIRVPLREWGRQF